MAETQGNIEEGKPKEGQAVESVTEEVPHAADADSSPGPYEGLDINRPPVSTNEPQTPIAHSLVAGAGAPSPEFTPPEEQPQPEEVQQTPDELKEEQPDQPAEPRGPGRPKKSES